MAGAVGSSASLRLPELRALHPHRGLPNNHRSRGAPCPVPGSPHLPGGSKHRVSAARSGAPHMSSRLPGSQRDPCQGLGVCRTPGIAGEQTPGTVPGQLGPILTTCPRLCLIDTITPPSFPMSLNPVFPRPHHLCFPGRSPHTALLPVTRPCPWPGQPDQPPHVTSGSSSGNPRVPAVRTPACGAGSAQASAQRT